jgi:hypothetical protein
VHGRAVRSERTGRENSPGYHFRRAAPARAQAMHAEELAAERRCGLCVFATVQLGTHLRAKSKRDDMSALLRKMRYVRI